MNRSTPASNASISIEGSLRAGFRRNKMKSPNQNPQAPYPKLGASC
jgi:hypothetical protein